MFQGKTLEQLIAHFNIKNDLTPEEESVPFLLTACLHLADVEGRTKAEKVEEFARLEIHRKNDVSVRLSEKESV